MHSLKLYSWDASAEVAAQKVNIEDLDDAIRNTMAIMSTAIYKETRVKMHLCDHTQQDNRNVIWACRTTANYLWLASYAQELFNLYYLEFHKEHRSRKHILTLTMCAADIAPALGIMLSNAPMQRGEMVN